jgi:hypothetical protein
MGMDIRDTFMYAYAGCVKSCKKQEGHGLQKADIKSRQVMQKVK